MKEGRPYFKAMDLMQTPSGNKRVTSSRTDTGLWASELYCPKCKAAMPVRERLLLILPDGELHEYLCVHCGSSLGERTTRQERKVTILLAS